MIDEDAFLRAIYAAPGDDAVRLAYADWLQERGDPRAEYLRVEYRVRTGNPGEQGQLAVLRRRLDAGWLSDVFDARLGPDWCVVLQSGTLTPAEAALADLAPEAAGQSAPAVLASGLPLAEARALVRRLAPRAASAEFRPGAAAPEGEQPATSPLPPALTRHLADSWVEVVSWSHAANELVLRITKTDGEESGLLRFGGVESVHLPPQFEIEGLTATPQPDGQTRFGITGSWDESYVVVAATVSYDVDVEPGVAADNSSPPPA